MLMRYRRLLVPALALGASLALTSCHVQLNAGTASPAPAAPAGSAPSSAAPASPAAVAAAPAAGGADTLLTEPSQGFGPVYSLIGSARTSVDLTMYELSDPAAEADLAAAAHRGAVVRVILDKREEHSNTAAFDYLSTHGVKVTWSSSAYTYTHQKTLVVNNATAIILTANLTSRYYSETRDFGVIDRDPHDVAAIVAVFNADFAHAAVTPGAGDDLVWSPTTAQARLLAVINGAHHSLRVYTEEMADTAVQDALMAAAKRGVSVQVVGENTDHQYDAAYAALARAGVQVRNYTSPSGFYIHAKVILADYGLPGARMYVGSVNFSNTSLNRNRELGLIISAPAILASMSHTFTGDFAHGQPGPG
jgi:cardiolipin synthase